MTARRVTSMLLVSDVPATAAAHERQGGPVLGEIETGYGTGERYVREESGLVAYAEKVAV